MNKCVTKVFVDTTFGLLCKLEMGNCIFQYIIKFARELYNIFASTEQLALASYYYSQSSNPEHTNYVLKYLDEHSSVDIDKNWWWLFQATFIAKKDLEDLDKSLYFAEKLAKNQAKEAPLWTKQMPAFISEKKGDGCMAFKVIKNLMDENVQEQIQTEVNTKLWH